MRIERSYEILWKRLPTLVAQGYLPIVGEFNSEMTEFILQGVLEATRLGLKELTLLIDSEGGSRQELNSIKGIMLTSGLSFKAVVCGAAYSAAFLLLESDVIAKRVALAGATLRFHYGFYRFDNEELAEVIDAYFLGTDSLALKQLLQGHLAVLNSVSKVTGIPVDTLRYRARYELPWSAEDAYKSGLVSDILPELPATVLKMLSESVLSDN